MVSYHPAEAQRERAESDAPPWSVARKDRHMQLTFSWDHNGRKPK